VVTLEADVTAGCTPVTRVVVELALLDFAEPVRARDVVLEQLLTVEPMLHAIALNRYKRRVPLSGRLHCARGRRVKSVRGAG